jgi:hypothetical protein
VARYPDLRELSRLSPRDFSEVGSLEQISRREKAMFEKGYPASFSAEWCALRLRYEELLLGKIRKERNAGKFPSRVNNPEAEAAKWCALGNETAQKDYEDFAPVDTSAPDVRRSWRKEAVDAVE